MAVAIPLALKAIGAATASKVGSKLVSGGAPSGAPPAPAEPTIDDAASNRSEIDRIRRRKGVLANIFAGASPTTSTPTVGVKTLLGGAG